VARRKKPAAPAPAAASAAAGEPASFDTRRFLRNLLVAFVPVVVVWLVLTPFYNRFLLAAGENVVHLVESPDVTELLPAAQDRHHGLVTRRDFPPSRRLTQTFRVTDLHFHLVLLGALFLAVPEVPLRKRLADLGVAALASVFFHLVLVLFWVEFVYATQLGAWSMEHYGAFARNFWGLGKHLLDLPFKLALPFVLWAAFYLDRLLPGRRRAAAGS
jgi:hypothetical protein